MRSRMARISTRSAVNPSARALDNLFKPTSDYRAAVDEAYSVLEQLMLGPVCTRETRELAYG